MGTHGIVSYLVGLAVGYWVLTLAAKEKGRNQMVGKVIGWVIIVAAAGGILCKTTFCVLKCGHGYGKGYECQMGPGGGKWQCHGMKGMMGDGSEEKSEGK